MEEIKIPESVPEELKEQVAEALANEEIDNADVQTEFTVFEDSTLEGADIVIPEEEDE